MSADTKDIAKPAENLTPFQAEPAKIIGSIATAASAIIGLLIVTGAAIPTGFDAQVQTTIQAIGAMVMTVMPLIAALRIRKEVVPVDKVPGATRAREYIPPRRIVA